MKKTFIFIAVIIGLLIVYLAGPKLPEIPLDTQLPSLTVSIDSLERYISDKEHRLPVRPDNEAVILWGDSVAKPTKHVLLYLHGFTASRHEGYPIIPDFVKEFKVNAYLPRLAGHGLNIEDPLLDMTPANLYNSAKEALVIAHKLGEKVIIMGTSTGCTLALMLAADFPGLVEGLILYSPNIKINNAFAPLLSKPWGLQLAKLNSGGKFLEKKDAPESDDCKYWYCRYRVEAQVYLQQMVDMRMNKKEFEKVYQPVFMGYYYKDKKHQDETIDVKAALKMFDELSTPSDKKVKLAFPTAGVHTIAYGGDSQAIPEVRGQTFEFARRILGM